MEEVSEAGITKITEDIITTLEEEDSTEAEDEEETIEEEEVTTIEVATTTNNFLMAIQVKTTKLSNASSSNLLVNVNSETNAHSLTEMNSSDKLLIIK